MNKQNKKNMMKINNPVHKAKCKALVISLLPAPAVVAAVLLLQTQAHVQVVVPGAMGGFAVATLLVGLAFSWHELKDWRVETDANGYDAIERYTAEFEGLESLVRYLLATDGKVSKAGFEVIKEHYIVLAHARARESMRHNREGMIRKREGVSKG